MTREECEEFVREQVSTPGIYGIEEDVIQRIVDRWEDDREDARRDGIAIGQELVPWSWSYGE